MHHARIQVTVHATCATEQEAIGTVPSVVRFARIRQSVERILMDLRFWLIEIQLDQNDGLSWDL